MEFRQVGKSGLYISKLSLGTMTLGEAESSSVFHGIGCAKEEAFRIMDLAIDQGINCFDTANIYGGQGMVEKLMGCLLYTSAKFIQYPLSKLGSEKA